MDGPPRLYPRPLRDQVKILHDGLAAAADLCADQQEAVRELAQLFVLAVVAGAVEHEQRIEEARREGETARRRLAACLERVLDVPGVLGLVEEELARGEGFDPGDYLGARGGIWT